MGSLLKSKVLVTLSLGLSLLLTVLIVRPDTLMNLKNRLGFISDEQIELTPFYHRVVKYHRRVSSNAPGGAVQFIGDSFVEGLCVAAVTDSAINFGIGGDTTLGMLKRIPLYPSLKHAAAIVLAGGFNDMWRRPNEGIADNYRIILQQLPSEVPIVMNAVFPVDEREEPAFSGKNRQIDKLNGQLREICYSDNRCTFVDISNGLKDASGNLATGLQDGDGLHLGTKGNAIWIEALRKVVAEVAKPQP
ncbi:MAG TPA: hypothetical protein ENJ35_09455 [Gammaproteobacteria bacterium]|nr:hypothetical protein [Gammaproteobacteria bacterium]